MLSYQFCEICKNTYYAEHLRKTAFGIFLLKHNDAKRQNYAKRQKNYKISNQPPEMFYKKAVLKNFDTCLFANH